MGGYNLKKYARGPLTWHNLTSHNYWEFKLNHAEVGDLVFRPSVSKIIADTGCSLNLLPDADYYRIFDYHIAGKF